METVGFTIASYLRELLLTLPGACSFCTNVLLCEPKACFESVSVGMLYQFFDWFLNQKVGKGGRKKKGTKKQSSLGTDWKQFRLVYERVMEKKLDPKLNQRMHKVKDPPTPNGQVQPTDVDRF